MLLHGNGKVSLENCQFYNDRIWHRNISISIIHSMGIFYRYFKPISPLGTNYHFFGFLPYASIEDAKREIDGKLRDGRFPDFQNTGSLYAWEYR